MDSEESMLSLPREERGHVTLFLLHIGLLVRCQALREGGTADLTERRPPHAISAGPTLGLKRKHEVSGAQRGDGGGGCRAARTMVSPWLLHRRL